MVKKDYRSWSKEDLIKEVEALKKQKTYGLVWEKDKTQEAFDYYINWDGQKTEEKFPGTEHKLPVLKEVVDKEILTDKNKDYNLLIEGDNYHALATLNFTHAKSIDVIYIDPPYNTGNKDFKYNDEWIEKDDSYKHSKWLTFMEKRLKMAKNLLRDTGVIFISIDDNEFAQLKLLCDEIFGEDNLLDIFYMQVRYAQKSLNEKDSFQKLIEHVLVYARNSSKFIPNKPKEEYSLDVFNFKIIEKAKGKILNLGGKKVEVFKKGEYEIQKKEGDIDLLKATWASGSVLKGNTSGKFFHNYLENRKSIDGLEVLYKVSGIGEDGLGYRYFTGPKKENTTKGLFYSGVPTSRREEIMGNHKSLREKPIVNFYDYSADFGNIMHEGGVGFRGGKKPVKMLKNLINIHPKKDITILDFFAGSGSTGQATLEINKDDEGTRKFILCTNNEENICTEYCYPRIKNVIKGYGEREGAEGNLKYFKTDFVDSAPTDKNKKKIVDKSTEMICIKENAFIPVKEKKEWKIFKNHNYYLGIVFDEDSIEDFVKEAKKLDKKIHVYVFSLDESVPEKEFKELKNKAKLCPIPEVILHVYRRIFK